MIVSHAFLSPAALLAPALTKASSGRAHEVHRSFRFKPHDEHSTSMPRMPIGIGDNDRQKPRRGQLLALRTVRRGMEQRPTP